MGSADQIADTDTAAEAVPQTGQRAEAVYPCAHINFWTAVYGYTHTCAAQHRGITEACGGCAFPIHLLEQQTPQHEHFPLSAGSETWFVEIRHQLGSHI